MLRAAGARPTALQAAGSSGIVPRARVADALAFQPVRLVRCPGELRQQTTTPPNLFLQRSAVGGSCTHRCWSASPTMYPRCTHDARAPPYTTTRTLYRSRQWSCPLIVLWERFRGRRGGGKGWILHAILLHTQTCLAFLGAPQTIPSSAATITLLISTLRGR